MTSIITAVVLALLSYAVPPEPAEVLEIRDQYNQVKSMIEGGGDIEVYRTEVIVNSEDLTYPAVGHYVENITFFWKLNHETGDKVLLMVISHSEHAAWSTYTEILYDDSGKPLFSYFSQPGYSSEMEEIRQWYSGGDVIYATCAVSTDGETEFVEPSENSFMRDPDDLWTAFMLL